MTLVKVEKQFRVHEAPPYGPVLNLDAGCLVDTFGPYKRKDILESNTPWPIIPRDAQDEEFYFIRIVGRRAWLGYVPTSYFTEAEPSDSPSQA
jgi:hypothetical protein